MTIFFVRRGSKMIDRITNVICYKSSLIIFIHRCYSSPARAVYVWTSTTFILYRPTPSQLLPPWSTERISPYTLHLINTTHASSISLYSLVWGANKIPLFRYSWFSMILVFETHVASLFSCKANSSILDLVANQWSKVTSAALVALDLTCTCISFSLATFFTTGLPRSWGCDGDDQGVHIIWAKFLGRRVQTRESKYTILTQYFSEINSWISLAFW